MLLLLGFAFLSGLVTILAPCIWPLLPIVLSSSALGKGHQRPLGITVGIMVSFAFFTLAISSLIRIFHLDPNILRLVAVLVIGFLGFTMIIPPLSRATEGIVSRLAGLFGGAGRTRTGFAGGFVTGLSLGIVWSPCAGPILAAIATLAATGTVTFAVILITLAYVVGVGVPLFLFAYGGQQLILRTRFISSQTGHIQQIFGVVMLLTALAIYTHYDTYLQAKLLSAFPALNLTRIESNDAVKNQLDILRGTASKQQVSDDGALFNEKKEAPEFVGISNWLNTNDALTLKKLRGKVVLVDFWTYTCINCIRTLPFVTSWYDKYKDDGFVVVGVHTPEFAFEHATNNVNNAIAMYNIHYPVAQDNDYATWNAYSNEYWPAEYLIDAKGTIRRIHFGEGEYDQMEMAIQKLLKEAGETVSGSLEKRTDQTPHATLSPETYLGERRMQYFYPTGSIALGRQQFTLSRPLQDSFSLGGEWTINEEQAVAGKNAVLLYNFNADKVFLVMRPGVKGRTTIRVFLDDKLVDSTNAGGDVTNGIVTIDTDRLYTLIDLRGSDANNHMLRLEFETPGTEVYAFTFG